MYIKLPWINAVCSASSYVWQQYSLWCNAWRNVCISIRNTNIPMELPFCVFLGACSCGTHYKNIPATVFYLAYRWALKQKFISNQAHFVAHTLHDSSNWPSSKKVFVLNIRRYFPVVNLKSLKYNFCIRIILFFTRDIRTKLGKIFVRWTFLSVRVNRFKN